MTARRIFWGSLGALGLFLGFPNPFQHLPPLVLLLPLALCVLGMEASGKVTALRRGWLTGLVGASAALYWVALPLHTVGQIPWLLTIPCVMALGAYVGLYAGLFSTAAWLLRKHSPGIRALELGLLWYLLEWVRGFLFTGFSWLNLGSAFVPWPLFLQGASVVGGYALGGVYVTLICWLARPELMSDAERANCVGPLEPRARLWSGNKGPLWAGIALLALLVLGGQWRLSQHPLVSPRSPGVRPVLFVEGNVDQNQKWDPKYQLTTVNLYLSLTQKALAEHRGPPPLVIWPETSMPFYYQEHARYNSLLRSFVAKHGITLILGAPGYRKNLEERSIRVFNRAFLLAPDGSEAGFYEKEHLVPFGEYLPPLLAFDFLKPILQGVGDFTPGSAVAPLRLAPQSNKQEQPTAEQPGNTQSGTELTEDEMALGMLICYESIFPELAQERVKQGANILLNISNDGWFGNSSAARQHLELAAVRSIEQGRWLLRGTNTGISAVYDNMGRLVAYGSQFTAQSVPAYMKLCTPTTRFHALAPWLPGTGLALFVGLCILGHLRRRQ